MRGALCPNYAVCYRQSSASPIAVRAVSKWGRWVPSVAVLVGGKPDA